MNVEVSVIVPVCNTEKYLRSCVDSIIAQTIFEKMEVILVDDGSTDNSPGICDEYAGKFDNIVVIHQNNAGVSTARNAGIDKASGKYIGFVDSDDYLFPDMYKLLLETAVITNADMAACGLTAEYPEKKIDILYPFPVSQPIGREEITDIICMFMLHDASFNSCCNKIFRGETITGKSLFFKPGKRQGEDREFLLRFLAYAKSICYIDYSGYYYRMAPSGAVQTARADYAEDLLSQYKLDFELFGNNGLNRKNIEAINTLKLMEQVAGALSFAIGKQKGKDRRNVIKSIIMNAEIRELMTGCWKQLMEKSSRFNRYIYVCIRAKSILGLRVAFLAMKLKVSIYKTANGGHNHGK